MQETFIENYKGDAVSSFRNYKKMAERAFDQVTDEEFFGLIDEEANSIALIAKHLAGNMLSRWSDFLTTDGEKPDRDRDSEFELKDETRAGLIEHWERGWQTLFDNLEPLSVADFSKTVTIRGEAHTVVEAINRQLSHYAYHIGQIVLLAKHFRSTEWKTLSIPKKGSAAFNARLAERQGSGTKSDKKGLGAALEISDRSDEKA